MFYRAYIIPEPSERVNPRPFDYRDHQFKHPIHHLVPNVHQKSSLFAKGVVHMGLGDLHRSEDYFLQSYDLSRKLKNVRFQLDNIDYLSQIYLERKRPNDAFDCVIVKFSSFIL